MNQHRYHPLQTSGVKKAVNTFMLETIVGGVFSYELILADREQNIQVEILAEK